jgi:hypothetical protein
MRLRNKVGGNHRIEGNAPSPSRAGSRDMTIPAHPFFQGSNKVKVAVSSHLNRSATVTLTRIGLVNIAHGGKQKTAARLTGAAACVGAMIQIKPLEVAQSLPQAR